MLLKKKKTVNTLDLSRTSSVRNGYQCLHMAVACSLKKGARKLKQANKSEMKLTVRDLKQDLNKQKVKKNADVKRTTGNMDTFSREIPFYKQQTDK